MKNNTKIWSLPFAIIGLVVAMFFIFDISNYILLDDTPSSDPIVSDWGESTTSRDTILTNRHDETTSSDSWNDDDSDSYKEYLSKYPKQNILNKEDDLWVIDDEIDNSKTTSNESKAEGKSKFTSKSEQEAAIMFEMHIEERVALEARIKQLEYEKKIEKLKSKPFAFGIEDDVFLEKKYECFAYIGNNKSLDSLIVGFENGSKHTNILLQDSIKVNYEMSIKLVGKNFEIEPITEEKQLVIDTKDYTEWKWYITPLESGNQLLYVYVYAHIYVNAGDAPYELEVYKEPVFVKVGFMNGANIFFKENWEWITTALIPLIYFGYRNRVNLASSGVGVKNGTVKAAAFCWECLTKWVNGLKNYITKSNT